MRTTVLVCLITSVFVFSSTALSERADTREERWERPADQAASGISGFGDEAGPGDAYNVIITGDGNDILNGTSGNDHIRSGGGEDQVQGLGGNDILEGGPDGDLLSGGEGNDQVRGQTGDDQLLGYGGDDLLVGGPGRDKLFGGGGNDLAYGGVGMDEGHYFVEDNTFSTSDYYDGGPGYDLFNFRVPPGFDIATANQIEIQFMASPGYLDFGTWGINLVIVNFEDFVVVWEPGVKGTGSGQPLATEDATWGRIKALYR